MTAGRISSHNIPASPRLSTSDTPKPERPLVPAAALHHSLFAHADPERVENSVMDYS
jgi:hypothetical protein